MTAHTALTIEFFIENILGNGDPVVLAAYVVSLSVAVTLYLLARFTYRK